MKKIFWNKFLTLKFPILQWEKNSRQLSPARKNILADFPKPDIALNSLPAVPLANLAVEEFSKKIWIAWL